MPFNTQFFHDDYDDGPGFDDAYDGDGMGTPDADVGEQDLLAATAGQTRRVRPQSVNYAKRAKRVDVRKLKENIWKGLDIVVAPQESKDNMVQSYIFLARYANADLVPSGCGRNIKSSRDCSSGRACIFAGY